MNNVQAPFIAGCLLFCSIALSASAEPAETDKLPHLQVDVAKKQVRVECEALAVEEPLEFFCVMNGTSEHESVLRSAAKASDLHLALLMIGLKPGEPVRYSEAAGKWLPPHGPPLQIHCEFEKDGMSVALPAYRMMRGVKSKEPMPVLTWIFAGSRVMPDGNYAADVTGYLVSIVNFELTVIDIPKLASSNNETLEWETNLDVMPPLGTRVWMVIEPAGDAAAPVTQPAGATRVETTRSQTEIDLLRQRWLAAVRPHGKALQDAAQAHYEVIAELRARQQQLINEADELQMLIDQLEKEYQDLTSPHPPTGG
jgi:hypothetical protein